MTQWGEGQEIELDLRDLAEGSELTLDRVLAVSHESGFQLGKPVVAGAIVTAQVLGTTKGAKVSIQKFRRRKNYRRRTGHRQSFTRVRISKIQLAS